MMSNILACINNMNPHAKIAVFGLLYRPRDFAHDMAIIKSRPHLLRKYGPQTTTDDVDPTHNPVFRCPIEPPYSLEVAYDPTPSGYCEVGNQYTQEMDMSIHGPSTSTEMKMGPDLDKSQKKHPKHPNYDVEPMERKRRNANKAIRKACKAAGVHFYESWKTFFNKDDTINLNYYADDGLHLSQSGILALTRYVEGNVATLMDSNIR
jgi:hypothetical protein